MPNENSKETLIESTFYDTYNEFTPYVFKNDFFGSLTAFLKGDKSVWFIGKDVARKLDYKDPKSAIDDLVPNTFKEVINLNRFISNNQGFGGETPPNPHGGNPNRTIIHEMGLYSLIFKSQLNNSIIIEFQNWSYQMIMSMRQYGIAVTPQIQTIMDIDPYKIHQIAQQRLAENLQLQAQLKALKEENDNMKNRLEYYATMVLPNGLFSSTIKQKTLVCLLKLLMLS